MGAAVIQEPETNALGDVNFGCAWEILGGLTLPNCVSVSEFKRVSYCSLIETNCTGFFEMFLMSLTIFSFPSFSRK
jgi:hypothetical protein